MRSVISPYPVRTVMGPSSAWEIMQHALAQLKAFGIPHEARVLSTHRAADQAVEYSAGTASRGGG